MNTSDCIESAMADLETLSRKRLGVAGRVEVGCYASGDTAYRELVYRWIVTAHPNPTNSADLVQGYGDTFGLALADASNKMDALSRPRRAKRYYCGDGFCGATDCDRCHPENRVEPDYDDSDCDTRLGDEE